MILTDIVVKGDHISRQHRRPDVGVVKNKDLFQLCDIFLSIRPSFRTKGQLRQNTYLVFKANRPLETRTRNVHGVLYLWYIYIKQLRKLHNYTQRKLLLRRKITCCQQHGNIV